MATEKRLIYIQDAIDIIANTPSEIANGVIRGSKKQWTANNVLGVLADRQFEIFVLLDMVKRVDAVEVVRCKDCEFWNDGWFPECTMGKCKRGKPVLTEPHHYCSYGVRRLDVPVIIKDESFIVKEEIEK